MREQVPDRDLLADTAPEEAELREILAERVAELQLATLDERHDRRRGERLADGSDLEERLVMNWERVLEARQPVPHGDLLGANANADGDSRHACPRHGSRHARIAQRSQRARAASFGAVRGGDWAPPAAREPIGWPAACSLMLRR